MPGWLRNIFRLSWYHKPPVHIYDCPFCEGAGVVHPDGTPARTDEVNPNITHCGNCAGRGIVYGDVIK
jgi:hypothetical protein